MGGKAAAGAASHHRWDSEAAKAAGRKGGLATAAKNYRLNHREGPVGTKVEPGAFDCYATAKPDEPLFTLLARDPLAPLVVRLWAEARRYMRGNGPKVEEAIDCAKAMSKWYDAAGEKMEMSPMSAFHDALHACLDVMHEAMDQFELAIKRERAAKEELS